MTAAYSIVRDVSGMVNSNTGALPSQDVYNVTLPATTKVSVTAPNTPPALMSGVGVNKNKVLAKIKSTPNSPVYVAVNVDAAVPAGATFAATSSVVCFGELAITVNGADVLNFYTPSSNVVCQVEFFAVY